MAEIVVAGLNLNIVSTAQFIASEGIVSGTRVPAVMKKTAPILRSLHRTLSCAGQTSISLSLFTSRHADS